jgi:hypothetical protein
MQISELLARHYRAHVSGQASGRCDNWENCAWWKGDNYVWERGWEEGQAQ